MAEKDGIFDAKMELKLTSCNTLTPFSEAVELTNLRGAISLAVHVYVDPAGHCEPCVDVAKNCGRNPRLIVLRPMSVQFLEKKVDPVSNEETWPVGPWLDLSASKITPDTLATLLTFKAPGSVTVNKKNPGLGRPQFYFDGLLNLLLDECVEPAGAGRSDLEDDETCESERPARLTFYLAKLELAANGKEAENESEITKKLHAVTVQFIAAYGKFPVE